MSKSLNDVEWKLFSINNIIDNINIAKSSDFGKLKEGQTVFIGRQETNNGIQGFVDSNYNENANCITISMVATKMMSFWQSWDFATSQNILILRNCNFNKYNAKFICSILNKYILTKYDYGKPVKLGTFPKEKIMLPINSKGEPDYKFMEEYIKEREAKLKNQYKEQVLKRVKQLQAKINGNGKWGEFRIKDIFPTLVVGKSKGLNHLEQVEQGGIAYLGATNRNNGVLCFVEKVGNEKLIQKGNCVAFIRNGEGSMGYSVYKAENFIATSDITLGYNNKIDKYSGMFITTIADRVRGKYSFNYKRSDTRLKKEILSLPVDSKGEPDYKFMEDYMKYLEQKKLLEYLDYIK